MDRRALANAERILDCVAQSMHARLRGKVDVDELRFMGRAGLMRVLRADTSHAIAFEAYARKVFRGEMLNGLDREKRFSPLRWEIGILRALNERSRSEAPPAAPSTEEADRRELVRRMKDLYGLAALSWTAGDDHTQDPSPNPEEQLGREQVARLLKARVRHLSTPAKRTIVERYYWREQSLDAIAEHLGVSTAKVWRTLQEALAELESDAATIELASS
jgi:RNA polymerase sigma factor (sigma-70 family)